MSETERRRVTLEELRERFELQHEMTYHEMCAVIERLSVERDEARELLAKCACGIDYPDDVCMVHSPVVQRLEAELAGAVARTQELEATVGDLLNAIAVVQQSYADEDGEYVASWAMELLGAAVGRSQDWGRL